MNTHTHARLTSARIGSHRNLNRRVFVCGHTKEGDQFHKHVSDLCLYEQTPEMVTAEAEQDCGLTSAEGHSKRYSENLSLFLRKTLSANQCLIVGPSIKNGCRASYHSEAGPLRV